MVGKSEGGEKMTETEGEDNKLQKLSVNQVKHRQWLGSLSERATIPR